MSSCINKSSDVSTQFYSPLAHLNCSQADETPINSFSSPRSDSMTAIGNKLCSLSCLSPNSIHPKSKFPLPVLSLNRIHKHKTQANLLIKKKNLKIRVQEQPAPVPKPSLKLTSVTPSHKDLLRERQAKKKKIQKPQTKAKPQIPLTERSHTKINKTIKKSSAFEIKKKIKADNHQEAKKPVVKRAKLKEKDSQIRIENLTKFKSEKFSPRAAWGVDERKFAISEKVLKDIETQREARRKERKHDQAGRKRDLGLSKFLEIGEELGFKPRSSSNPIQGPKPKSCKEPRKQVKKYLKHQKRKTKERLNDHMIQEICKETKRMISLKLLEIQSKDLPRKKKTTDKPKLHFRPKPIGFSDQNLEELAKIYADKSSEFAFEPESHSKLGMSEFLEYSIKPSVPLPVEYNAKALSAVIKIQHHIRHFLNTSRAKRLCQVEVNDKYQKTTQKSESFPSTTQETAHIREEEKTLDQNPNEQSRSFLEDDEINDSISEAQIDRYQSITDILQRSGNFNDLSFNIDPDNENSYKKELHEVKETKELDFSFSSYVSEKSFKGSPEDKEEVKDDGAGLESYEGKIEEFSGFNDLKNCFQESLDQEEKEKEINSSDSDKSASQSSELNLARQVALVSRASPVSLSSEEEEPELKVHQVVVGSEDINEISEIMLNRLLIEILILYSKDKKVISIDKDPIPYIDQLIFHVSQQEFKLHLSKPLEQDPLEVLEKMQSKAKFISKTFDSVVLSLKVFNEIESFKAESQNAELNQAQRFHDKLIFDSCNEILQSYRPYGANGLPLPWSAKQNVMAKGNYDLLKVIPKIARKIEVLGQFEAGKSFGEFSGIKEQDWINNLREEKIGLMILQDISGSEEVWVDYEFSEMDAIIDISNLVLEELMFEVFKIV